MFIRLSLWLYELACEGPFNVLDFVICFGVSLIFVTTF
jgi:hypothetical protein